MYEDAIPVKVLDGLVREVVKWMEVHRPVDASREETTRWVLSAAFSAVSVAGAACASIGALGAEIAEDQFVAIAREAFRRAQRPGGGASPDAVA